MPKFNVNDYVDVQTRINQFHADHKEGSIEIEVIAHSGNSVVVRAIVRPTLDDRPVFSDIAGETAGSTPKDGANFGFHIENAATSAIGRALANMGYAKSAADRPSREEMEKVNRLHDQYDQQQQSPAPQRSQQSQQSMYDGGQRPTVQRPGEAMTVPQKGKLAAVMRRAGFNPEEVFADFASDTGELAINRGDASRWIDALEAGNIPTELMPFHPSYG